MRKYHIKNNITVVSEFAQDIVINCFYISDNECEIITRQLDSLPALETLTIKIDSEAFMLDPRNITNKVKSAITTFLKKEDDVNTQIIPKVIIQTSEHFNPTHAMYSLREMNPDYEYKFFDDTQRREFIKNAFSNKILDAYDMLVPGAFRADLFRYAYLFIHGGCYFDDKIIPRVSLNRLIRPEDELILCEDAVEKSYLNSIIMTKPKHFMFLKLLLTACDNIYAKNMSDMLSLTGPKLMYNVFNPIISPESLRLKHVVINDDYSSYKNFPILDKQNPSVILFHKTTPQALSAFCHDSNHYRQLWNRNEVFYKNKKTIMNLDFYVYPNIFVDTFDFICDIEELTIERNDCPAPWHFWLKIKILNTETSRYEHVDAGFSKIVRLPETTRLNIPPKVYLSSHLPTIQLSNVDVAVLTNKKDYKKESFREQAIYFGVDIIDDLTEFQCQVAFMGPDASYHCREKDRRTSLIYMLHHILKLIASNKSNHYSVIKIVIDDIDISVNRDKVTLLMNNLFKLLKYKEIDLSLFLRNFLNNHDIVRLYNQSIQENNHHIEKLNEIIKSVGELLEGNVFYEHHCKDFSVNGNFQNKRYNLFYYGMMAVDILEVGFNAGHSALLYLISNPYSKIHFFDLGEHQYSRLCFEYLNTQFPGRLSVTWGDSTLTIPIYHPASVFDFIHIDGGHSRYVAESDFYNCQHFANEYTYLIIDDYDGPILTPFCNQLVRYNKVEKIDLLFYTQHHILFRYK
jgi:mannosyltransferase OCH1-like enzyme